VKKVPKFEQRYNLEDFRQALKGGFKTAGFVAKKVGCARSTAVIYLDKLIESGEVEKFEVDGGQSSVWMLKKEE
jgi:hypothetical protein